MLLKLVLNGNFNVASTFTYKIYIHTIIYEIEMLENIKHNNAVTHGDKIN